MAMPDHGMIVVVAAARMVGPPGLEPGTSRLKVALKSLFFNAYFYIFTFCPLTVSCGAPAFVKMPGCSMFRFRSTMLACR